MAKTNVMDPMSTKIKLLLIGTGQRQVAAGRETCKVYPVFIYSSLPITQTTPLMVCSLNQQPKYSGTWLHVCETCSIVCDGF